MTERSPSAARIPQQKRGRMRFEQILCAAGSLLQERGFEQFTVSELAQRLGYTRASIYKFFPTPQAIYRELNTRQLSLLEAELTAAALALPAAQWQSQVRQMALTAAQFHNHHSLARLLILGGTLDEDSYRNLESTIARLGALLEQILENLGIRISNTPVNHPMLVIEIGTCCLRTSFFLHGEITTAYAEAAGEAMVAYLEKVLAA